MKKSTLAANLLKGSQNIDRMRDDVTKLVTVLIATMREITFNAPYVFNTAEKGYWRVRASERRSQEAHIVIQYWRGHDLIYSSSSYDKKGRIDNTLVQAVYEDSCVLVDGLVTLLPTLMQTWAPILRAAEVQFPEDHQ